MTITVEFKYDVGKEVFIYCQVNNWVTRSYICALSWDGKNKIYHIHGENETLEYENVFFSKKDAFDFGEKQRKLNQKNEYFYDLYQTDSPFKPVRDCTHAKW